MWDVGPSAVAVYYVFRHGHGVDSVLSEKVVEKGQREYICNQSATIVTMIRLSRSVRVVKREKTDESRLTAQRGISDFET